MMKKMILLILAFRVLASPAQKINSAQVPEAVKRSFVKQYPGTSEAKWEMENGQYEASFKKNNQTLSALFTRDGVFTESELDIQIRELPPAVLDYLTVHFKSNKLREASIITRASGELIYEAGIKGKDILFDVQGKYIKEVKD